MASSACSFAVSRALAKPLIWLVTFYRLAISPWLGMNCRYQPTCSAYAEEAIRVEGIAVRSRSLKLVPVDGVLVPLLMDVPDPGAKGGIAVGRALHQGQRPEDVGEERDDEEDREHQQHRHEQREEATRVQQFGIDDDRRAFIESRDFFFLSTVGMAAQLSSATIRQCQPASGRPV